MPSDSRYLELVEALEKRHMMPERPPGLESTREGLARLKLAASIDPSRVVLVAGTNGKGSTAGSLESLLLSAGENVGLYTSPHLVETTERFRHNGVEITSAQFVRAHDQVAARLGDLVPTHFEMLTLMAVWLFLSGDELPPVDRLILEVGLGGRWDSTNAVPHETVILTRIGRDHENLLGNSLSEIALNKLDTLNQYGRLVHGVLADREELEGEEVDRLAAEVARDRNAKIFRAPDFGWRVLRENDRPRTVLESRWGDTELSLSGRRAAENANLALAALDSLGHDPSRHLAALQGVRLDGRMQLLDHPIAPCPIYLSGDHNPQGASSLAELLPEFRKPGGVAHLVVGIGADKNADDMLRIFSAIKNSRLHLTTTPFKGRPIEGYGEHWLGKAASAESSPRIALDRAITCATSDDLIVVTGSLYLVGEVLRRRS